MLKEEPMTPNDTHQNPFAPPLSNVASEAVPPQSEVLAGKGRRLATLLIDYAGFMALSAAIGLVIALLYGNEGMQKLQGIPDILLGVIITTAYYVFFEGIWARTPGKFLLGTVVVTEAGGKPGLGQVLGRTLCRYIPFEAFSFLGEKGWHDSISRTRVVRTRSA
jgi:uncharacterized RDD family membrane protein YckC